MFFETDQLDTLDFYCPIVGHANGNVPRMANLDLIQRQCAGVLHLEETLQLRQLNQSLYDGSFERVSNFQSSKHTLFCARCPRKFHLFARMKHRRKCGHVVCSSCSKTWHFYLRDNMSVLIRVCFYCFNNGVVHQTLPVVPGNTIYLEFEFTFF